MDKVSFHSEQLKNFIISAQRRLLSWNLSTKNTEIWTKTKRKRPRIVLSMWKISVYDLMKLNYELYDNTRDREHFFQFLCYPVNFVQKGGKYSFM
jgi:hypothetical protein